MSKCIKVNELSKYFKFILLAALFKYFRDCILGYNFNKSFEDFSLIKFLYYCIDTDISTNILNSKLVEYFFNYIGTLFFSFFFRIYELKITQKNLSHFFNFKDEFAEKQILSAQFTKYEITKKEEKIKENILSKFKNYLLNNTSFVLYAIISLIWVAEEITLFMLFEPLKDLDFWFLEILILTQIYSKIFLVQIYRHQSFAIILNIIPSILKITCIILTINTNEDVFYSRYKWWIFVGILLHCFLTAINSFIDCSLKAFLDLKYTTISQLLMFYSSSGILISFIICIFSTYFPCSTDENKNYLAEKMCKIKENSYTYFDSYKIYFNSFSQANSSEKLIRTFIIILDALIYFLKNYFFLLSIKYTDPVHAYFNNPIYYIFRKTVLIINNSIINKKAFLNTSNYRVAKYCLDLSGDFFCLFGFLIYLEIIELNFCGLNKDLKKKITQRGITDNMSLFYNFDDENTEGEENNNNNQVEMHERYSE